MNVTNSSLMPIEMALKFLLAQPIIQDDALCPIEEIAISQALGRILAEDQIALFDVPAHDNSAMDGFVLNSADCKSENPCFRISQTIAAGHVGLPLESGTVARIFTGASIPEGADVVVIQENTRIDEQVVTILESVKTGRNIRRRGHDIAQGERVLIAGHRLVPQDLGLLASLGITKLKVRSQLTVAIINTGDEIIAPDQELGPGQIYDSNSFTLEAMLQKLGFKTIKIGIVVDDLKQTELALKEAACLADCIISTGGVSVGDADFVKTAVDNLGSLSLWKLAIKPGKPFAYGVIECESDDARKAIPFFGLPGNPVAVFVTFSLLVRPYILKMQGANNTCPAQFKVAAGFDSKHSSSRQEYLRVRLENNADGEQELTLFPNQGSSILTSLSWADGLAVIPIDCTIMRGDYVSYIPFTGLA